MKRISSAVGFAGVLLLSTALPAYAIGAAPTAAALSRVKTPLAHEMAADKAGASKSSTDKNAAKAISAKPMTASELSGKAAASANALGLAVFSDLLDAAPKMTTVVSPYDLALTINLLAQGAGGKTKPVFETGLHLVDQKLTLASSEAAMAALRQSLPSGAGVTVETANGIWAAKSFPINPAYAAMAKKSFAASAQTADFADPNTLVAINKFVSDTTHGKIPTVLSSLPANAKLAIVGTVYVKGVWADKFNVADTVDAPFVRVDGSSVTVPTMHRTAGFSYLETDAFQSISLPFRDPHYALVILLPKTGKEAVVRAAIKTDGAKFVDTARFFERHGTLALPRLKLSWEGDLLSRLKALGMSPALDEGADYSVLSAAKRISVGAVAHKVTFDMDEEGAEAAAATAVVGVRSAMVEPPFVMTVDRPFYFALREKMSGAVLFVGFVNDPVTATATAKVK